MKNIFLALILHSTFLTVNSFPQQQGWFWQNPKITGNTLFDTEFFDTLTGWAVGSAGQIFKTTDGCLQWETQMSPVDLALRSISFIDENTGWISGDEGSILTTNNGGETWSIQNSNTESGLRFIKFIDENTGYAFGDGGAIITTTDGGENWTAKSLTYEIFYDGYVFSDSKAIVIGGHGVIFKTTDGGESWLQKTSNTENYLYAIDFTSPDVGWVADYSGQLHKTTNGGEEWTTMNNISSGYFTPFDLKFVNDSTAYVSGDGGLYKSIDTAKTWQKQTLTKNNSLWGACFLDTNFFVFVGLNGGVVRTTNGGDNWEELYPEIIPDISGFTAVQFLDNNLGFASGWDCDIVKTTDSGENWSVLPKPNDADLYAMFFINQDTGWVCGDEEYLAKTTNGGESWETIRHNLGYPYASIQFVDTQTGWMLYKSAYQGSILKSTNGGLDWSVQLSGDTIACWDLYFINADTGFVGGCGQLFRTTNGGENWVKILEGFNWCIRDIKFNKNLEGWIVGDNGRILYSDSTWSGWAYQISNTDNSLLGVSVIDDDCWAVGFNGTILHSTNGGETWIKQRSNTTSRLFSVSFPAIDTGWVVGVGGAILKTIDGGDGITSIDNEDPDYTLSDFQLMQNYPNPFNPVTRIRFSIPQSGLITIRIFNILGQQITTIVNQEKSAGIYEVEFDGSELSSGIYFYQLKVIDPESSSGQDFIQTKKMILLK